MSSRLSGTVALEAMSSGQEIGECTPERERRMQKLRYFRTHKNHCFKYIPDPVHYKRLFKKYEVCVNIRWDWGDFDRKVFRHEEHKRKG